MSEKLPYLPEGVMSLRIMVVDDTLFMRQLLRGILEEAGWEVVGEAADGNEAVEKYRELQPDVTTMDIVMPKKSGIEALAEIMNLDSSARVLVCSALGQEALVVEAKQAGAKGYLVKPFDPQQVKMAIRNALLY
jgi:two-component system chemotaxis response regulator CheY